MSLLRSARYQPRLLGPRAPSGTQTKPLPQQYLVGVFSSVFIVVHSERMAEDTGNKFDFSNWNIRLDSPLAKLCTHCQLMFDNWNRWQRNRSHYFPHHQDPTELERAAASNCSLCYQFWRAGPTILPITIDDDLKISPLNTYQSLGVNIHSGDFHDPKIPLLENFLRFDLKFRILDGREGGTTLSSPPLSQDSPDKDTRRAQMMERQKQTIMYRVTIDPSPKSFIVPSTNEQEAQNTRFSIAMAKEWLRDCSLKHERCQNRASQHIPTRLVGTAMGRCRVYQRDELNAGVEYATLSHCWGRTRYLTLSKNNLQQLETQIPSEDLSRTVQDAITIAHDLGFEYIWVDTLCIIQDDLADWKREAASMTSVYENSSLNIAAAGARDGRDGCFFSRPTHWNCKLQLYNSQHTLEYSAAPVSLYSQCLIDMPLMERGWVLQERLLAVRTLHFTTTELFWECNHTTACESFPERLPGDMRMSSRFLHKKTINDSMWPWIIARYSACKLTYVKDKLVAISGLARKIHQQTNDQYVAGLWRKHLEAQLCWFIWIPGPRRETEAYIAPSWSWASVDVPVHTNHVSLLDRPVLISVVDVKIGYTEFDSFGTINSATMRVRCCGLHRASFDGSTNELLLPGNKGVTGGTVMPDNSPDGGDETIQEGLLLPVFVDNGNDEAIIGLVLKLSGQGKGVYRRVGRFCVSLKESLIDTLGQIVDDGYGHLSRTYAEVLRDDSGVTLGYMIDII